MQNKLISLAEFNIKIQNFESMSFNPFSNSSNFSDGNQDPDVNFFLDNIPSLNTEYFSLSDAKIGFAKFESSDTFSVLQVIIRSLRKNVEDFKELYKTLNLNFSLSASQKPGQMTIN